MWRKRLNNLLKAPTHSLLVQAVRYGLSGGMAFVADFGLLYVLTDCLHVHYLLSSVFSFATGLLITYLPADGSHLQEQTDTSELRVLNDSTLTLTLRGHAYTCHRHSGLITAP